jgi:hypothetical protein
MDVQVQACLPSAIRTSRLGACAPGCANVSSECCRSWILSGSGTFLCEHHNDNLIPSELLLLAERLAYLHQEPGLGNTMTRWMACSTICECRRLQRASAATGSSCYLSLTQPRRQYLTLATHNADVPQPKTHRRRTFRNAAARCGSSRAWAMPGRNRTSRNGPAASASRPHSLASPSAVSSVRHQRRGQTSA